MKFFKAKTTDRTVDSQDQGDLRHRRRGRSIGQVLIDQGSISPAQLGQALKTQQQTGRKLGRLLVEMGFCTQEEVSGALREVIQKVRVGDILVDSGYLTESQLQEVLQLSKSQGTKVGQVAVAQGFLTQRQLLEALAEQLQIPHVDLRVFRYDPGLAQQLPEKVARQYQCILLAREQEDYLVGMVEPTDIFAQDEISRILGKQPRIAIVDDSKLGVALDKVYRRGEGISRAAEELSAEMAGTDFNLEDLVSGDLSMEAPVARLLQSMFEDAVQTGASDIHIEPGPDALRIRQRIDGTLQERVLKEKQIANPLVSRLKIMANLNISERRLPQDGRFNIRVLGRPIDVRLSTLPLSHGESVVMRLLDQSAGQLNLEHLGMPEDIQETFQRLLRQPHGIILVTGPTGSGKTTTLYSALRILNEEDRKIITVEDPVEYQLPRVCQVQVQSDIGLTFSRVLRTALRQDPDTVMIGEIRDQETAAIAVRAALTGHLVLSTIHTNDALSTPVRLLDMGIEHYLVAPSLSGVMAQRLARRTCRDCARPDEPDARLLSLVRPLDTEPDTPGQWMRGPGCSSCNNTGFSGRIGIYELLELTPEMSEALRTRDTGLFTEHAISSGFRSMGQRALDYAKQGMITLEEVVRLTGESDLRSMAIEKNPAKDEEV